MFVVTFEFLFTICCNFKVFIYDLRSLEKSTGSMLAYKRNKKKNK